MGSIMRKVIIIIIIISFVSLLPSCGGDIMDDSLSKTSLPLSVQFSVTYELEELWSYFSPHHQNETIENPTISYDEVNTHFPIEVSRPHYAMYAVSEGGYYYVWWVEVFTEGKDLSQEGEKVVYFSAYLPSAIVSLDISDIKVGESTFSDLKRKDPMSELCLLLSRGVYSYHFLNAQYILEIEYDIAGVAEDEQYIVSEIKIISRIDGASSYSTISDTDLP